VRISFAAWVVLLIGCAETPGGSGGSSETGCQSDPDCPLGLICLGGACEQPLDHCEADEECPGGRCDLMTNGCVFDVDPPSDGGAGGGCLADEDCLGGRYCSDEGNCERGCRLAGDCAEGLVCDEASRQCRPVDGDGGVPVDGTVSDAGMDEPDVKQAEADMAGVEPDAAVPLDAVVIVDPDAGAVVDQGGPDPDQGVEADAAPIVVCQRDADCGEDEACLIVAAPDGPGFVLSCGAALADGRAEDECDSGLSCASRTCIGRAFCFSPCIDGDDCPSGACRGFTVGADDDRTQFLTCERPPDLCESDTGCDEAQMCLPIPPADERPNAVRTACIAAPERAAVGEACARDADCASLECLEAARVCWGPCRAGEAEDCLEGQRCYLNIIHFIFDQDTPLEADDRYYGMNGCLPDEGSDTACPDGRCPNGEACRLYANQAFTGVDLRCRTTVGNLQGGALCVADDSCQSGVCLGNGFCLGVCDGRGGLGQCAAGSVCGQGEFTIWDRGTPNNPADDVTDAVSVCVR
jgi:hypothetical protein